MVFGAGTAGGRSLALPVIAIIVLVVGLGFVIAAGAASGTWGYDYAAYAHAAERLLAGEPLYDTSVDLAGGFAIFLYPPPFAIAFVPFAFLGPVAGLWAWTGLLVGALVAAVALMPVPVRVRWIVLLLAGLHWPTLYAIRLGQVGPILLLLFVLGWRWLDRPGPLGATIGLGAIVKVQPGLLAVWALLTGRVRAAATALVGAAGIGLVTLPIVGLTAWQDYAALLSRVNQPVTTPHNFTPGAVAFQAGASAEFASIVQLAVVVGVVVALAAAIRLEPRIGAIPGYLTAVVATQLLSPLLWDHYAVILLAPVAWLLAHRAWWAAIFPLLMAWPLIGILPAAAYPLTMVLLLVLPMTVAFRSRVGASGSPAGAHA